MGNCIDDKLYEEAVLAAYVIEQNLAKDICFAMTRCPGCYDIEVTEVRDHGWHVDCRTEIGVPLEDVKNRIELFLRKNQLGEVYWA